MVKKQAMKQLLNIVIDDSGSMGENAKRNTIGFICRYLQNQSDFNCKFYLLTEVLREVSADTILSAMITGGIANLDAISNISANENSGILLISDGGFPPDIKLPILSVPIVAIGVGYDADFERLSNIANAYSAENLIAALEALRLEMIKQEV